MSRQMFDDVAADAAPADEVDEFGFPLLPPDHTDDELAAILASGPMSDPRFLAEMELRDRLGPDGSVGVPVDRAERLLADVRQLPPDLPLAGALRDLTVAPARAEDLPARLDGTAGHAVDGLLTELSEDELRQVVAGWERIVSWAKAAQGRVAAELMDRTEGTLARDSAAGEIAAELHVTTSEAWQIAMRGEGTRTHPQLATALAAGRIDAKKADTFLRAGSELSPTERGEAIDDLLPAAPGHTWKWISERLNARAVRLHGRRARRRDITDHCNVWAEQAGPGRGRIVADLPVTDAAKVFNTVQAAAGALKNVAGETRPLGALRAAAFTALTTGHIVLPCPDADADADADASTNTNTRLSTGTGTSTTADPNPASDVSIEPPRMVEPVLDTDLIPVPDDPDGAILTAPDHGTRLRVLDVRATVHVTVPASVLLDPADTTPGILEGIGPIPADDAARIAADGTWRRLLTDPVSGILQDYSTRTYAPGATLRAAVSTRDQTCTFPGCDRAATAGGRASADLDHIDPFDEKHQYAPGEPGQTRAANLHPLCRKHHNLKTHAHWKVTRDPETGHTRWTPPSGRTHTTEPAAVDPTVRYGLTHGLTLASEPPPGTHEVPYSRPRNTPTHDERPTQDRGKNARTSTSTHHDPPPF